MLGFANPKELFERLIQADEAGVRLEIEQGRTVWEFFPSIAHQHVIQEVFLSVRKLGTGEGCFRYLDAYVQLADGSIKRPDLALYCTQPPLTTEVARVTPGAVVEVVSRGYERKDLDSGPSLYLSNGVRDVLVVQPELGETRHFRRDGVRVVRQGVQVALEMGCAVTV